MQITSCQPPLWAQSGHLQTLAGHLLPSPVVPQTGERHSIELPGGDKTIAHFYQGNRSDTIVYCFHGLGGHSHGSYMQRTALIAMSLGCSVFLYNHRGCGAAAGLAREPYHSGRAEDLSALIAYGKERFPDRKHLAIGFSLSANALLLLSSGQRASVLPDAAIAVNAPINLDACAKLLRQGVNRIYDLNFMIEMRKSLDVRRIAGAVIPDVSLEWNSTIHDFDELYTAPASGFKNRADYYEQCSAKRYLSQIQIPTVILTAEDDPFVRFDDYREVRLSPLAHLHVEKHGGHMGYLSKDPTPLGTKRWLDYALWTFMGALID